MDKPLAGPWHRLFAAFIDGLLIGIFGNLHWSIALLALVYHLTRDAWPILKGQSIGKKAMGIRVVKQGSGEPITGDFATSAVRQVSLLIPFFNLVDSLMVFSKGRQRFGDRWAKTVVVNERA